MRTYVIIRNNIVVNRIVACPEFIAEHNDEWDEAIPDEDCVNIGNIGYIYLGNNTFTPPEEE